MTGFIVPLFIDWTSYRSLFEKEASQILGHRVRVIGQADARLLPRPTLSFTDIRVGETEGQDKMRIEKISLQLELMPLLRGEVQVSDLLIENPTIYSAIDDTGQLDWFLTSNTSRVMAPEKIFFDNVRITNGILKLIDARTNAVWQLNNFSLEGNARSLVGPFKANGHFDYNDHLIKLEIATGRLNDLGNIRLSVQLDPVLLPFSLAMDGIFSNSEAALVYDGQYTLNSLNKTQQTHQQTNTNNIRLRSQGRFLLTPGDLELQNFVLAFGEIGASALLEGSGRIILGDRPNFDVNLQANQINLNSELTQELSHKAKFGDFKSLFTNLLASTPLMPNIEGQLKVDIKSIVLGDGIVRNLNLTSGKTKKGWRIDHFSAEFPGDTELRAAGDIELDYTKSMPQFRGIVNMISAQPGRFTSWLRTGINLSNIPPPAFRMQAQLFLSREWILLEQLEGKIGQDSFSGIIDLKRPTVGPSQLALSIETDRFDLTAVNNISKAFLGHDIIFASALNDKVSITLKAANLITEQIKATDLFVNLMISDNVINIDHVAIQDLAGASLEVNGRLEHLFTNPIGNLSVVIDAKSFAGFQALLLPYVGDSRWFEVFVKLAPKLSPSQFKAQLTSKRASDGIHADFEIIGIMNGSPLDFKGSFVGRSDIWESGDIRFSLQTRSDDVTKLLNQFSIPAHPLPMILPGDINLSGQGTLESGLLTSISAKVAGADIISEGFLRPGNKSLLGFDGSVTLESEAIEPLLRLAGINTNNDSEIALWSYAPVRLASQISLNGGQLEADITNMQIDGTSLQGSGTLDLTTEPPILVGDFRVEFLNLPWLISLGLGGQLYNLNLDDTLWPNQKFTDSALPNMAIEIGLNVSELGLRHDINIGQVALALRSAPGNLHIDLLNSGFAGGILNGALHIRNTLGSVVLDGRINLNEAALEELVWRDEEGQVAALGSMTILSEFEGSGTTMSEVISSLTGGGAIKLEQGEIRNVNLEAFNIVINELDSDLELEEKAIYNSFNNHFFQKSMPFERIEGAFSIVSGIMRADSFNFETGVAEVYGGGSFDLMQISLSSDWTLSVNPKNNIVIGAQPRVAFHVEGPLINLKTEVDTSPFMGYLTLRAYEQEVKRIEMREADILEKERFGRELKRLQQSIRIPVEEDKSLPANDNLEERVKRILQQNTP